MVLCKSLTASKNTPKKRGVVKPKKGNKSSASSRGGSPRSIGGASSTGTHAPTVHPTNAGANDICVSDADAAATDAAATFPTPVYDDSVDFMSDKQLSLYVSREFPSGRAAKDTSRSAAAP